MKKIFTILLLTITTTALFGQNNLQLIKTTEKSFPTNLNKENFKKIKGFNGKVVAFDGIIEQVENSRNNTPFYKLRISENNYLWTVLMFKNEINKTGDTIRVVGYLRPLPDEPNENEKKYLDGKYIVISFGLVDFANSNILFLFNQQQKQEWIDGKIPTSK